MGKEYNLNSTDFQSLKTASKKMFNMISTRLNVNTAYVAKRGETAMTVLSSFNKDEEIIPEGYEVDYGGSYCRHIINHKNQEMHTPDVNEYHVTRDLAVTPELGVKGYLGVTLTDTEGTVFGTLCVMDREEKVFSDEDVEYLKSMADLLSHIIELDQTKFNMGFLNVPILPITNGVSILTLQGVIDDDRASKIMDTVLRHTSSKQIDYIIIDLSGLVIVDDVFPTLLVKLVQSLQLIGAETIITGITPEAALHNISSQHIKDLKAKTVQNLEGALEYIGFYLQEK
ncbi:STAS domain-containing protein [Pontibacillus salipaludis]|uniref:STAS domain-containing protein n=1 Tax=Pontibacillus salipaludis TaxID=1697394 RepID=A0ABQ1QC42_9BACI|nr:STAS domain-containing protein [Pontibacillus salipaludis]GGD21527.1 hypothetical protein GCM10011389_31490 [Pontibacillus salipaludis]